MSTQLAASDLAARLVEVAARLDTAGIVPNALDVTAWSIGVQLADEAAVDRAADLFTAEEDADPRSVNYARVAFFDDDVTIHLYSERTVVRCGCGSACNHRVAS